LKWGEEKERSNEEGEFVAGRRFKIRPSCERIGREKNNGSQPEPLGKDEL